MLHALEGATENQRQFANNAIRGLIAVVNNEEFLRKVKNGQYSRRRLRTEAGTYVEADNDTILKLIKTGKELNTVPDNEIDIQAKLAALRRTTVGSVKPPSPIITTNTLFYNDWMEKKDSLSLAAHWMHEWLHVAGFRHVKLANGNPDRQDVNYTIGGFVIEIGRQNAIETGEDAELVSALGNSYLESYKEHSETVEEEGKI
jgi:hypothetical protein